MNQLYPVPVLAEGWQEFATPKTHPPLGRKEWSGTEAREGTKSLTVRPDTERLRATLAAG